VMARGGGFNDVWWLESPFFWSEFHGNSDVFLWFYGIFMDIWWDILYIYTYAYQSNLRWFGCDWKWDYTHNLLPGNRHS
jgi:hypothetical protein